MNKNLAIAVALSMLWGCSSQPAQEEPKAGVEERSAAPQPGAGGPAATPVKPGAGPSATPVAPTAKPAAPVQRPDPLKDPNSILSKRSIFYDYDSDTIKDEFRALIQAHARHLADNAGAKMLIQGNCDERGSREYNIALGQRRAEAVKRMLVLLGARDAQIESVSLGEEKPVCTEHAEGCWAKNRRDDMLYNGEY